jgi:hypothetical protein
VTQRKILSTRPLDESDPSAAVQQLNKEHIPFLRQLAPGTTVTGSRGGATADVLRQILVVLAATGVIKDSTTP